tara:strand:+ start:327 stop:620 length:294 start_codon:yes stop_codon:yes gene_type:complete
MKDTICTAAEPCRSKRFLAMWLYAHTTSNSENDATNRNSIKSYETPSKIDKTIEIPRKSHIPSNFYSYVKKKYKLGVPILKIDTPSVDFEPTFFTSI